MGSGPAVVLVHGGMQAAQNLMKLAAALSEEFEVVVPDRRGRGSSGPYGDGDGVDQEAEDLQAIVAETGAEWIFGLSSGALLALRAAATTPALRLVALYEPPLSIDGSVPTSWMPQYERQIASGKPMAAIVTVLKGLRIDPAMQHVPDVMIRTMLVAAARSSSAGPGDVRLEELVPTMHVDMQIVRRMADSGGDYADLDADVLLLGGTRSPDYLTAAVDELERRLPTTRRVAFDGLGHTAPNDDGDPDRVAVELRSFFRPAGRS